MNGSDIGPRQFALEEIKILQEIIARHESHCFRIKAAMFALLAGLATALYSQGLQSNHGALLLGVCVLAMLFLYWELLHRVITGHAIARVEKIESDLRGNVPYDGPKVVISLRSEIHSGLVWREFSVSFNWWAFVTTMAAICLVLFFVPPERTPPKAPVASTAHP